MQEKKLCVHEQMIFNKEPRPLIRKGQFSQQIVIQKQIQRTELDLYLILYTNINSNRSMI